MGPPEAPRAVSVGLRNCYLTLLKRHKLFLLGFETAIWHVFSAPLKSLKTLKTLKTLAAAFDGLSPWDLPRPHGLFLLGFETAIWHFRSATSCFYWASKLLSGTFSAPLKTFKGLKTLKTPAAQQLSTAFRCFAMGPPEAPRAVSVGLRNCYLALPKRHKLFLLGFETAIWLAQAVSIGLRNCYLARFQHPLKASKPSQPSQQLSTAFRCFAMGPPEAPQAVSVGLRNCYLALPKRHKLFLLGFETAIWHTFQHPLKPSKASKPSQQLSTAFRCFAVGLRNC